MNGSPESCLTELPLPHPSVGLYLRVGLIVKLLRPDPPPHQVIPHGVGQGEVVVPGRGDVPVLDQGEVQVAVEALLQLRHVLHLHDAPDADLLALLLVAQRFRHGGLGWAGCGFRAQAGSEAWR